MFLFKLISKQEKKKKIKATFEFYKSIIVVIILHYIPIFDNLLPLPPGNTPQELERALIQLFSICICCRPQSNLQFDPSQFVTRFPVFSLYSLNWSDRTTLPFTVRNNTLLMLHAIMENYLVRNSEYLFTGNYFLTDNQGDCH